MWPPHLILAKASFLQKNKFNLVFEGTSGEEEKE